MTACVDEGMRGTVNGVKRGGWSGGRSRVKRCQYYRHGLMEHQTAEKIARRCRFEISPALIRWERSLRKLAYRQVRKHSVAMTAELRTNALGDVPNGYVYGVKVAIAGVIRQMCLVGGQDYTNEGVADTDLRLYDTGWSAL